MTEPDKDDLDGCDVDFQPTSDEQTKALLVAKGKEQKAWTEEQEQKKAKSRGA